MKKLSLVAVFASACLAVNAFASLPQNPVAGIIIGANLGAASIDAGSSNQTRVIDTQSYAFKASQNRAAGNLYIGNLWGINNMFSTGVQIGATYWGEYSYKGVGSTSNEATYSQMTMDVLFVGQVNISRDFYAQILVGPAFNISEASGDLKSGSVSAPASVHHKASPLFGAKIGFNVTPDFSLYLTGMRLVGDSGASSYEGMSQRLVPSTYAGFGFNYNMGQ